MSLRVIAMRAEDLDLRGLRFRQDLYYRLRVIELHVPPPRGRAPDEASGSRGASRVRRAR